MQENSRNTRNWSYWSQLLFIKQRLLKRLENQLFNELLLFLGRTGFKFNPHHKWNECVRPAPYRLPAPFTQWMHNSSQLTASPQETTPPPTSTTPPSPDRNSRGLEDTKSKGWLARQRLARCLKTPHLILPSAFRALSEQRGLLGSGSKRSKKPSLAPLTTEEVAR